jgi:hypothetical protein
MCHNKKPALVVSLGAGFSVGFTEFQRVVTYWNSLKKTRQGEPWRVLLALIFLVI